MPVTEILNDPSKFAETLFRIMRHIQPGLADLEFYEFCYALAPLVPSAGWGAVKCSPTMELADQVNQAVFFNTVQLKPTRNGRIVLDENISRLTQMLFVGLVKGEYPAAWVKRYFHFDIRGFFFLVNTDYFPEAVRQHFGGEPCCQFEPNQQRLEACHEIGYKEFQAANAAVDQAFIELILKLILVKGAPLLLALAGPSAAGKTEIVERLRSVLAEKGRRITTIEMDNFLKDGEYRDGKPLDSGVIHFELFKQSLAALLAGETVQIPCYDFNTTTSSHDPHSRLKPGRSMLTVQPADIVLMEGNFPFHLPEISQYSGIRIVYLTSDAIRLKRKWKRDIDLRKKYDPTYFCNRYFRTQFLRAEEVYRPLMQVCDVVVDTTNAAIWLTPELQGALGYGKETGKTSA